VCARVCGVLGSTTCNLVPVPLTSDGYGHKTRQGCLASAAEPSRPQRPPRCSARRQHCAPGPVIRTRPTRGWAPTGPRAWAPPGYKARCHKAIGICCTTRCLYLRVVINRMPYWNCTPTVYGRGLRLTYPRTFLSEILCLVGVFQSFFKFIDNE